MKEKPWNSERRVFKFIEGKRYSGRAKFYINNIINQGDGIDIIKHYEDEEIIKTGSKKKV